METDNYLKLIYPDLESSFLGVWEMTTKSSHFIPTSDLDAAKKTMELASRHGNVYFSWGAFKEPPTSGRGRSSDVTAIPGFFFDVDLKSADASVHSRNDELPSTIEEALELFEKAGAPRPTSIRNSGNGAYFDYLFDKPWAFADDKDRAAASTLSSAFHRKIASAFKAAGYRLDTVTDFSRLTRMPGTINHKGNQPKPVTLIEHSESCRVTVASLQDLVRSEAALTPKLDGVVATMALPSRADGDDRPAHFPSIVAGCSWVRNSVQNAAKLSEPDWYAMASIMERCENGPELFHSFSKADPRYNEQEAASKLGRSGGPRLCETIHKDGFFECERCPFFTNENMSSPIQLGRLDENLSSLMSNYAYDAETSRYFNIQSLQPMTEKTFTEFFRDRFPKGTPHHLFASNRLAAKAITTDYVPGQHGLMVKNSNPPMLNLWRKPALTPQRGDASVILEHIAHIIPDEPERDHYLNVLAHIAQKPADKIKHVLVLVGHQGTGKSYLNEVLRKIVGENNMYVADSSDLETEFNAPLGNRQIVSFEEFIMSRKLDTYETLKLWVTDKRVTVNEKGIKRHWARTPMAIFAYSNHGYPINLPADDRRFWIYKSPAKRLTDEYYKNCSR